MMVLHRKTGEKKFYNQQNSDLPSNNIINGYTFESDAP